MEIYGNGTALSEKVLDLLWARQNLIVNNIANVDTPGFKSQYVTFEDELAARLSRASAGGQPAFKAAQAIGQTRGVLHTTIQESSRLDGNNVDMDQEQVELVRTAYEYQYMVNSISNELKRLQSAAAKF